jgi:hypothetical protein
MGRARAAAAFGLLLVACNGSTHFDLPLALSDEDQGLVLAVRSPSGLSIFAFGKTTGAPADLDLGDAPADLVLLVYSDSLRVLRLDPGPLAIAGPSDAGHALAAPGRTFAAHVQRRSIGSWTQLDVLPSDLASLRVRDPDPAVCVSRGGCASPDFPDGFCDAPCPEVQTSTAVPVPPLPAAMPAPVRFGRCDPPWMWVTASGGDGITTCEPPAVAITATCASDQAQIYLAGGCAPIGDPCSGEYATNLSTIAMGHPILYVKANAPAGGNGTIASPFARIRDALSVANANTVVALSQGTFSEAVNVPGGVVLVGACAGASTIAMPAPMASGAVVHFGAGGGLWNVSITEATGLTGAGVSVTGGMIHLFGVVVFDVGGAGIALDGATVDAALDGVLVRRSSGDGIECSGGANAHVNDSAIEGGRGIGFHARMPSTSLVLDRVSVRERLEDPTTWVSGVYVERGATVQADGLLVHRGTSEGVRIDTSTADLQDVYVSETRSGAKSNVGVGVHFSAGTNATLGRASIANNATFGMVIDGAMPTTTARIDLAVFRGNAPSASDGVQHGLVVAGANVVLEHALFDGPHDDGLGAAMGATASVAHAVFRGGAILSIADSAATIGPVSVDGGARWGIMAGGIASTIALHDATVTNTGGMPRDREASGIRISRARAAIDRVLVDRTGGNGVYVSGGASDIRLSDATLLDTGTSSDGIALWAIDAPIRGERIFIRRHLGLAIHVFNYSPPGDPPIINTATCALSDVDIDEPRGTAPGLWIEDRIGAHIERIAVRHAEGGGFHAVGGAVITAKDLLLDANALFGATVSGAATLRLQHSVLSNNRGFGLSTSYTSNPIYPSATLSDVRIVGTMKDTQDGSGVGVKTDYANLLLSRFVIDGSEAVGVSMDEAGGLDLSEGTISNTPLGARVTLDGFDRWRLLDRVRFVGVAAAFGP